MRKGEGGRFFGFEEILYRGRWVAAKNEHFIIENEQKHKTFTFFDSLQTSEVGEDKHMYSFVLSSAIKRKYKP